MARETWARRCVVKQGALYAAPNTTFGANTPGNISIHMKCCSWDRRNCAGVANAIFAATCKQKGAPSIVTPYLFEGIRIRISFS